MSRIFSGDFVEPVTAEDEMDTTMRSQCKNTFLLRIVENLLADFDKNELTQLLRAVEKSNRNALSKDFLEVLKNALKNAVFDAENEATGTVGYENPEPTNLSQYQPAEPESGEMSNFTELVGATGNPNNWKSEVESNTDIPTMSMPTDLNRNSPEPDERFDASLESMDTEKLDWNPEQFSPELMPINFDIPATPMIHPGNHSIGDNTTSLLPMDNTTAIASVIGILGLGALCYVIRKWTPAGRIAAAKVEAKLNKQIGHARSKRQNRENKSYVLSQMTDSTIIVIDQPQDLQKPFKGLFIRKY